MKPLKMSSQCPRPSTEGAWKASRAFNVPRIVHGCLFFWVINEIVEEKKATDGMYYFSGGSSWSMWESFGRWIGEIFWQIIFPFSFFQNSNNCQVSLLLRFSVIWRHSLLNTEYEQLWLLLRTEKFIERKN